MSNRIPVVVGLIAGLVLFAESSHAWPLLWTVIAGALTIWLSVRSGRVRGWGQALGAAGTAEIIAGLLFFVATVGALAFLAYPADDAAELAANGGIGGSFILSMAIAALVMLVATIIGGAATYPLVRRSRED